MVFVLRSIALLALTVLLAGCGAGSTPEPTTKIDPVQILRILPTPQGLDQSSDIAVIDAARLQTLLAGVTSAEAAKVYEEIGFREAAVRTWSGAGGAHVVAIVSRWPDHQKATNVGGGAVQRLLDTSGAAAWTPRQLAGDRGARLTNDGSAAIRMLSLAVDDVGLLVRSDGPVTDDAIIRTMDLLTRPVRAATP